MVDPQHVIRALMIDDDEDDFILTRAQLALLLHPKIQLEWVKSFDEGLEAMRSNAYDVYLVDYRLGAESGLDLIRSVIALGCKKPIIMLTGLGDQNVDEAAMDAGAADYLVKGQINNSLLGRAIRYAIQRKQIEGELTEIQQRLADSREEERLQLARELHDGPLQDLLGVHFHLGVVERAQDNPEFLAQLASVQAQLQSITDSLRTICGELRPPSLAPFGLEQAIRVHARQFQEDYPEIAVQLDLDSDRQLLAGAFPPGILPHLSARRLKRRQTCARHASARAFHVGRQPSISEDCGRRLWLLCAGSLDRSGASWALWSVGSSERADSIGGQLHVQSSPELGTAVSVTAPRPPSPYVAAPCPHVFGASMPTEIIYEKNSHSVDRRPSDRPLRHPHVARTSPGYPGCRGGRYRPCRPRIGSSNSSPMWSCWMWKCRVNPAWTWRAN